MTMSSALPTSRAPARWQDFLQLLKPRVMSLVVFTAITGMVCADAAINPILGAIAILCIAVGAGASASLNMWFDADIDAKMRRTRGRPVPAGRVQGADALTLGVVLSLFSTMLLGMTVNWLAAGLLAFTILFYAVVYTMWLKRSTPQNIVIGGLAGALPPVIGWAAATGTVPLNAWLLCAIIFMWTPPHFWALSLYTSEDYEKAGVPMMPVVAGAKSTRKQILIYSLLFTPLCLVPAFTGLGGLTYLAVAAGGGLIFLILAWRVFKSRAGDAADPRQDDGLYDVKAAAKDARNLFAFSILYLTLLFATLLAEHLLDLPAFGGF
ncbi:MAG: heme o synthase [Phenylobacterium sp.]|uniref:Protoheme IX farnesyltransferase n=1 Tax=Phenylobacterium ferrooxidans TaxID=2982689 RepID=A0ABW6CRB2_9CAUL|nr:heme o synthase [Phenylobacterium sp.]MDO8322994.1 heme o synthase [Phenylobacterium sp.]MDO8912077.1 heme o synthase [Phenylobacterium sp.]MDP3100883.1 heme o synthase [Phenylobacterium sp.]MDP3635025.1 heme o synthase [Phenylobacterium sp.]MDP3868977.1 heme o synthase [Phenylobacterium sp.]